MTGYPVTVYRWKVTRHNLYINFSPTIVAHIISYALCGELLCDHNYGDRFYANVVAHEIIADYMIFILAHITSLKQRRQHVAPSQNHSDDVRKVANVGAEKLWMLLIKFSTPFFMSLSLFQSPLIFTSPHQHQHVEHRLLSEWWRDGSWESCASKDFQHFQFLINPKIFNISFPPSCSNIPSTWAYAEFFAE